MWCVGCKCSYLTVRCTDILCNVMCLCRMVAFTGEASEAVQYALHYLGPLVEVQPCGGESGSGRNGMVGEKNVLCPVLQLPDVFDLLHHANQVKPLFALEAVVGVCECEWSVSVCLCSLVGITSLIPFSSL